jgi:hypothetical protein
MATDLIEQVERNIKRKTSPMSTTTEEDDIVEGFSLPKKAKVVPITGESMFQFFVLRMLQKNYYFVFAQ